MQWGGGGGEQICRQKPTSMRNSHKRDQASFEKFLLIVLFFF